jgi:hypothetical protein
MSAAPSDGPRVVVRSGVVRCQSCSGRMVGYADVTTHPLIKVEDGRLVLGNIIDSHESLNRQAKGLSALTLNDELFCERFCGYHVAASAVQSLQ